MDQLIGEVRIFAGDFAPEGWRICDGALLNLSENEVLFSLIGTAYSGDGKTTFALPDLRGRVPAGAGVPNGGPRRDLRAGGGAPGAPTSNPGRGAQDKGISTIALTYMIAVTGSYPEIIQGSAV